MFPVLKSISQFFTSNRYIFTVNKLPTLMYEQKHASNGTYIISDNLPETMRPACFLRMQISPLHPISFLRGPLRRAWLTVDVMQLSKRGSQAHDPGISLVHSSAPLAKRLGPLWDLLARAPDFTDLCPFFYPWPTLELESAGTT